MKYSTWILIGIILVLQPILATADPSPARSITHPGSKCVVESTAGEYPLYKVTRGGNVIYAPRSDGISKAVFSPNGRYIAFSGSEVEGVDIKPGVYDHSVVILECDTGALRGFMKGFPAPDLRWDGNGRLRYTDSASGKEIKIEL